MRPVRQVLLHRPDPGPVHVGGAAQGGIRADGGAGEPLDNPELKPKFQTLLGSGTKPFECVGEVNECRAAVVLAAGRPDRADTTLLQELAAEVTGRPDAPTEAEIEAMRHPVGASFVPARLLLRGTMTGQRPKLGWSDLRVGRPGRRLGPRQGRPRGGAEAAQRSASRRCSSTIARTKRRTPTADGGLAALKQSEVVIKTPGISPYGPAAAELRAAGVTLVGGLGLWVNEADLLRVVYVTGTKGKSTTSSVIGHLLRGLGRKALVGGNFGAAPYDPDRGSDYDYWVIEVSSYTATDLAVTPPVTAVTSLHPDHLPWHGDVERYYRDKLSATSQPGADLTVANGDSELLRERAGLLGPRVAVGQRDRRAGRDLDGAAGPARQA